MSTQYSFAQSVLNENIFGFATSNTFTLSVSSLSTSFNVDLSNLSVNTLTTISNISTAQGADILNLYSGVSSVGFIMASGISENKDNVEDYKTVEITKIEIKEDDTGNYTDILPDYSIAYINEYVRSLKERFKISQGRTKRSDYHWDV